MHHRRVLGRGLAVIAAMATLVAGLSAGSSPADAHSDQLPKAAATPYLGWSSWSLQATTMAGLNPEGSYSWLTEEHVLQQADVMAKELKPHGYAYINIDAGWWRKWNWDPEYDAYGRPATDTTRFPDGIAYAADYVHKLGLKLGIYMPVGLEKGGYDQNPDATVYGAPDCTLRDAVYPDLRTTNGWDSSYAIDYSNGTGCGQAYINSIVDEFAAWGVDFLKLDGVGPGSGVGPGATCRAPAGGTCTPKDTDNYNNVPDVAAYHNAIQDSDREILLQVSWSLNQNYIADWQEYSDSWRIDNDIECYCATLTQWTGRNGTGGVKGRFADASKWAADAGPTVGWNNLDSLDVGNGTMDGLTNDERQTMTTLWAISAAPLYTGDDLTKLDDFGFSLLTNDEVIAIDQAGNPAHPVSTATSQQVWYAKNHDGSYTVALFNLADTTATVSANWTDLGFTGRALLRDVWAHSTVGIAQNGYQVTLAPHASTLLTVRPIGG